MFNISNEGVRALRRRTDKVIYDLERHLEYHPVDGREMALAHTKLQEAKMWLGMALGARGNSGYPQDLLDQCEDRTA